MSVVFQVNKFEQIRGLVAGVPTIVNKFVDRYMGYMVNKWGGGGQWCPK